MNGTVKNAQNNRIGYFDGLRGLACLGIMIGHFYQVYMFAEDKGVFASSTFDLFLERPLNAFVDGNQWFVLFFVVSGYLLGLGKIQSPGKAAEKSFNRFLRLYFPVLGACTVIVLLNYTVHFHNAETAAVFTCTWFQENYTLPIDLKDILFEPFYAVVIGSQKLNPPYWMLGRMFLASVYVYFVLWIREKTAEKGILRYLYILPTLALAEYLFGYIGFFTEGGMLVCLLQKRLHIGKVISVVMVVFSLVLLFYWSFDASLVIGPGARYYMAYGWAVFLLGVPQVTPVRRFLESGPLRFLGRICFGIYSFHFPVLSSFGTLLMLNITDRVQKAPALLIVYSATAVITLALSALLYYCVEKPSMKIRIKKIEWAE